MTDQWKPESTPRYCANGCLGDLRDNGRGSTADRSDQSGRVDLPSPPLHPSHLNLASEPPCGDHLGGISLSAGVNAKQENLQWSQGVCVNDFSCLKSPLSVDGVRSHTWSKLHWRWVSAG